AGGGVGAAELLGPADRRRSGNRPPCRTTSPAPAVSWERSVPANWRSQTATFAQPPHSRQGAQDRRLRPANLAAFLLLSNQAHGGIPPPRSLGCLQPGRELENWLHPDWLIRVPEAYGRKPRCQQSPPARTAPRPALATLSPGRDASQASAWQPAEHARISWPQTQIGPCQSRKYRRRRDRARDERPSARWRSSSALGRSAQTSAGVNGNIRPACQVRLVTTLLAVSWRGLGTPDTASGMFR